MISTLTKKHSFDPVFDSQKVYRLLLSAMANPGATVNIAASADKLFGEYPALLAVAMTLLDNEVSFAVRGSDALAEDIAALTLAHRVDGNEADFLFVADPAALADVVAEAKCGTLSDPEKSATVVILDDGEADTALMLTGPGIDGEIGVNATALMRDAVRLRDEQHYEYPEGIDLLFLRSGGELSAIPRLVRAVN